MTRRTIILGALCALFLLAIAFSAAFQVFAPPLSPISSTRESIEAAVKQKGSTAAYAAIKKQYAGTNYDMQHNVAHLLGEATYAADGLSGVRVCDAEFNYGCYHGFFKSAVGERGVSVLQELDAECSQFSDWRSPLCQHGLGHGLIEFFGMKGLTKALDACATLPQPDPVAGCSSGVFMGYNLRFEPASEEGFITIARERAPGESAYAPCDTVKEAFAESCYYQLAQWWNQVFDKDFQKFGSLCQALENDTVRSRCFQGIGNIAASSGGYDVARTKELCALMPSKEGEATCVVVASWAFEKNIFDHEKALEMCAEVVPEARRYCPV